VHGDDGVQRREGDLAESGVEGAGAEGGPGGEDEVGTPELEGGQIGTPGEREGEEEPEEEDQEGVRNAWGALREQEAQEGEDGPGQVVGG